MKPDPTIWDWPLRIWHWAFAGFIAFSLYSGLSGDIGLLEWHQRSGLVLLGLLVFRVGWGLWGGRYARFGHYWTTPSAFIDHFRRRGRPGAHTSPGVALAVVLLAAAAVQVGTGLFATDDIFTEGPLYRYVSNEFARTASWLHHRLHWLILGAGVVHLAAHAIYGLMRDPTPLAMVTGRKRTELPSTPHFWVRAALTSTLALGTVMTVVYAERVF
ncbi:MAG: cytochrome b/b6 domain-containing protein [Gammaproteobacteria bacterium]|nr:cytochrome b/b6 domain-containing protein [Gammaproteobacteria bacterium]